MLGRVMFALVALLVLPRCTPPPCQGRPEVAADALKPWTDGIGTIPLGDNGKVCLAQKGALLVDFNVKQKDRPGLSERWADALKTSGWEREVEGPWDSACRRR